MAAKRRRGDREAVDAKGKGGSVLRTRSDVIFRLPVANLVIVTFAHVS